MLLSTRDFLFRNPSPLLRGLLRDCTSFSTFQAQGQATSFSYNVILVAGNVVLQGVAVEGSTTPFPWLIFQRRELLFLWEVSEGDFKADCTSLASGQALPISYSVVHLLDCIISECICSGGLYHYFGGCDLQ